MYQNYLVYGFRFYTFVTKNVLTVKYLMYYIRCEIQIGVRCMNDERCEIQIGERC